MPGVPERLAAEAAAFVAGLRDLDLAKAPGVAETIDWTQALAALGCEELDATVVEQTLGAVLKYHEDFDLVRDDAVVALLGEARAAAAAAGGVSEALTRHLVTFGRVLREAGLEVGPGRMEDALRGLDRVDITRQDDVYWTLRTTLVARREDLEPFDRAFDAWFLRRAGRAPARREIDPRALHKDAKRVRRDPRAGREAAPADGEPDSIGHSAHEVLRHKDFAAMTPEELAAARALIAAMVTDRPTRRSHRLRAHRRGRVLRHARAGARLDRHRRRPGAPALSPAHADAAQARRAVRRVGLDGALHAARCCSTCTPWSAPGAASRSSPSARG